VEQLERRDLPSVVTWTALASGDWNVGSNWSTGSTPGAGDDVVINQPGNITVTHAQNVLDTIHSLTISDTLTLSGGTLNAGTILNSGTIVIGSGTSVGAGSYVQSGGKTVLQGGTLGALRPPESTALSFGGSSLAQVPNTASLNPTSQVTVEAWINSSSLSNSLQGIAGTWDDLTGNNRTYLLWIQSGKVAFYVSHTGVDYPSVVSTTTIQANQWYHVAGTFDGTYLRLYVNGVQEASLYSPGPIAVNTQSFDIGKVDGGGSIARYFSGQIANVGVFNVARSQTDIQADMRQELSGSEVGLVGYWTLSSASGGTVVDKTANGNNGTVSTPPPVATPVTGGILNIQGGTLTGWGTINADLVNAGAVDLGSAAGVLTVNGNYTQTATGTLTLEVGGVAAGTLFDQLDVRDGAALTGTLNVSLVNGFNPLAGQVFDAVHFGSESGGFATVNLPTSDGVLAFTTQFTPNSLELVGATVPPTSSVHALPTFSSPSFTVSWSGQDNPGGSGVAAYDIYVSDNGGSFVPFLIGTANTSAVFNGQRGHQYGFYSVATDGIGNREAPPAQAEATTAVPSQVGTTTTLTTSAPAGSVYGQNVTLTANVGAALNVFGVPTGAVQFVVDGTDLGAPMTLTGGVATLATSLLSAGGHVITATYLSDTSDFGGSAGGPLGETVTPAPLVVTVDDQTKVYGAALPTLTGGVTGLQNGDAITASFGTSATAGSGVGTYAITATLSDPGGALKNYSVTLSAGTLTITPAVLTVIADNKTGVCGAPLPALTASYTGFVNGDTAAVLTGLPGLTTTATSASSAGTYAIIASVGTLSAANYTFTFVNGTLTLAQGSTTTAVVTSAPTSVYGQPVTFAATVSALAASGGTPTGTVTFLDGTTPLATVSLVAGQASYTSSTLARGDHAITAVYSGDGSYLASTSAVLNQRVRTVTVEPDPLDPGKNALFVGGTGGDDFIEIEGEHCGKLIEVEVYEIRPWGFHFEATYPASGLNRVVVFGGGGNDVIEVARSASLPVLVFGAAANGYHHCASDSTAVVRGDGDGTCAAGLLAGRGTVGILVGGTTANDATVALLSSLLADGNDGVAAGLVGSHALDWLFAGVGGLRW
jgi:hypothetical protein